MKSLLAAMTAAAVLTAVATAVAKSLPNFPIVFATFGFVVIVLAGFVAGRFFIQRQRLLTPTISPRSLTVNEWFYAKAIAAFLSQKPNARCSFCGRIHREAGPF